MATESNTAVVQSFHNTFYAGSLDGVDELTTKDTVWASKILEQAFYTDPLMQCYLETQNKNNVHIYQKFGFEVVSDKEIPTGGLHNWGMLRQKR